MRSFMRTTLIATMLLVSGSVFGADISIGIMIGPPPPPYVVHVLPPSPSPEFVWVAGYWYPGKKHYKWHEGYWTRPPYAGARWMSPHYDGERYFAGYWKSNRGRVEHDHHWDKDHDRDYYKGHKKDHDKNHDH